MKRTLHVSAVQEPCPLSSTFQDQIHLMLSVKEQLLLEKVARYLQVNQHYPLASQLILPCCLHPVDFDSFQLLEVMLRELPPEVVAS